MALSRLQVLLTEDQARRLRALASRRDTSVSALLRQIVERALQEEEETMLRRRNEVIARLAESAHWLHRQAPDLQHTPTLLEQIREERLHDFGRRA